MLARALWKGVRLHAPEIRDDKRFAHIISLFCCMMMQISLRYTLIHQLFSACLIFDTYRSLMLLRKLLSLIFYCWRTIASNLVEKCNNIGEQYKIYFCFSGMQAYYTQQTP
jgi:hypothetical protein